MRRSRIADFVDGVENGVQGRVISDGCIGAVEVVVDGAGQADAGHVELLRKDAGTRQRTVAANDDQGVDTFLLHVVVGQLAAFGSHEFLAACCLQDGTSHLNDVAYVLAFELFDFTGYQAFVSSVDTFYLKAVVDGCTRHRTDGSVHSRSVSSGGQNTDALNCSHDNLLLVSNLPAKIRKS